MHGWPRITVWTMTVFMTNPCTQLPSLPFPSLLCHGRPSPPLPVLVRRLTPWTNLKQTSLFDDAKGYVAKTDNSPLFSLAIRSLLGHDLWQFMTDQYSTVSYTFFNQRDHMLYYCYKDLHTALHCTLPVVHFYLSAHTALHCHVQYGVSEGVEGNLLLSLSELWSLDRIHLMLVLQADKCYSTRI